MRTVMKKFLSGKITLLLLLAVFLGLGADQDHPLQTPPLSAEYAKWRAHVLPNPSEQSYQKTSWRASVLHSIVDAQKHEQPQGA